MSGVRDRGLDMSVGWDNTSKRHNYTTRRFPSRGRQVDLFYKNRPGRGSKSGAGMGVFASGVGEEYTRVTQVWDRPGSLALEININKELTICIQMVIIKVH